MSIDYSVICDLDINKMNSQFVLNEDDIKYDYQPFHDNVQKYNPIYNIFFNMDSSNYNKIGFNHKYQIRDLENVVSQDDSTLIPRSSFIKFSPLLDPVKYLIGKYDLDDPNLISLPNLESTKISSKLNDTNNSSYVDCFFSFLSSKLLNEHNIETCLDFYGSFLTVQPKYKINIADDFEYLSDSKYFMENMNKIYDFTKYEFIQSFIDNNSRKNKDRLCISDENIALDIEELDVEEVINAESLSDLEEIYNNDKDSDDSEYVDEDDDSGSEEEGDEEEDDDEDEEEDDDDSDEICESMYAYIHNFPVQMICLEKCENTLDYLFENELLDDNSASAALLQVIMSLLVFQKSFHFTHNDLHTNNIVFKETDKEFIYFKYNDVIYRVPTYGKIFKIIDFGRSIYKYKGHLFCSDSFAHGGDAATQYNFKPYFNPDKPVIEPNYSFDLCRLGCSIYDFIIDDESPEDMNELQKTIYRWCLDDKNSSILYKKNGSERYPQFKLYKMIARTVHAHTPENQLEFDFFKQYVYTLHENETVDTIDIDAVPCYAK